MKVKGKVVVKKAAQFHIMTCVRSHFAKVSLKFSGHPLGHMVKRRQSSGRWQPVHQTHIHPHRHQFTVIIVRNATIGNQHVQLFWTRD